MKCERCGQREASYFYKENINGKETKANLCAECAAIKENSLSFGELFAGGLMGQLFTPPRKAPEVQNKRCSLCGCDISFISKGGKVGCPQCYTDHEPLLRDSLRRLHGNAVHKGKAPRTYREISREKQETEQLEAALKAAIAAEEYEKAAEIRDKLRLLRGNS